MCESGEQYYMFWDAIEIHHAYIDIVLYKPTIICIQFQAEVLKIAF